MTDDALTFRNLNPNASFGPLVIAEVAQAHDGSLGTAHCFIDAVADAGAGAVKFQTHIAAAESTPAEPWRVRFSPQDDTRYEYWQRMEFTEAQWQGLRDHAAERGLLFISSPFSAEAVDLLDRVGVDAWKVASGEVPNAVLLEQMATGAPIILSSGMSPVNELDGAVRLVRQHGIPLAVLQCTTAYPTAPHQVGLNVPAFFRQRWGCATGLSDHSGTIFPALAASALGIDVIEVHVTLSRKAFGPDVVASVTDAELAVLCRGCAAIGEMLANPIDKDDAAGTVVEMRRLFTRSLVAARPLRAGHRVETEDLTAKKPGFGIPPDEAHRLVGRTLRVDVTPEELLRDDHFEEDL